MDHPLQRESAMICPMPFKSSKPVNPYGGGGKSNPYLPPKRDPKWIRLNLWEHKTNPQWVMILYENQVPFESSPTLETNWRIFYSFMAYNHLIPPYPEYTGLFRANHHSRYPYEFKEIVPILDTFNVEEPGTYFVAYTVPINNTEKIPLKKVNLYVEKIFDRSKHRGEHRAVARKRRQKGAQGTASLLR